MDVSTRRIETLRGKRNQLTDGANRDETDAVDSSIHYRR